MGFYIKCPFFVHQQHKRPTISCEDCVRLFESNEVKFDYIKKYCEDQWQACPFAIALTEIYERTIYMDEKDSKLYVAQKELEMSREYNKKLLSDIGRLKKKTEKLEQTIADMNEVAKMNHECYREELQGLRTKISNLEKQKQWAESVLAGYLATTAGPDGIVELDMKLLLGMMTGYTMQFKIDQDAQKAIAKIEKITKEEK